MNLSSSSSLPSHIYILLLLINYVQSHKQQTEEPNYIIAAVVLTLRYLQVLLGFYRIAPSFLCTCVYVYMRLCNKCIFSCKLSFMYILFLRNQTNAYRHLLSGTATSGMLCIVI